MKIKNYIWDFDGTLLDTYDFLIDSLKKSLEKNGVEADTQEISDLIHVSYFKASRYYINKFNLNEKSVDEWYCHFSKQIDYSKIRTFEHIDEVLNGIVKAGGKNYIFTHRDKTVYEMLEKFDLLKYFEDIVDITMPFPRKPSPDANIYLIEKHNLNKEQTMYVGDREIDILCGRDAGLKTCYFNKESTCDLSDYNIKDFSNFLALFVNN